MDEALRKERELAIEIDVAKEKIVKWPIEECQWLLFSCLNVLSPAGEEILSLGGTVDMRVMLQSVMTTHGRTLLYGVTAEDISSC
jgi:hypothetical protein